MEVKFVWSRDLKSKSSKKNIKFNINDGPVPGDYTAKEMNSQLSEMQVMLGRYPNQNDMYLHRILALLKMCSEKKKMPHLNLKAEVIIVKKYDNIWSGNFHL